MAQLARRPDGRRASCFSSARSRLHLPAVLALAACWLRPARAQQGDAAGSAGARWPINVETAPRPVTHALRAPGSVTVDGRLDEPAWQAATPITEFVQSQPHPGYPATERTAVRILYDDRRLYLGAMCYESAPDHLVVVSL